ncbi:hypothetical protein niasHT_037691 [Heterodera trifolii]|uniref:RNA helicase n=1 Tax=Heterodera trifolii TaxID=157864 RepID=A0ABD2IPG7_9BILA
MSDPVPDKRINKKKLENIERLRRKNETKISKNKSKKLAQLAERKKIKQTRESLFEMLQQYQLDEGNMNLLTSIASSKKEAGNQKHKIEVVRKLRCVSGEKLKNIRTTPKQLNHIETDSSSCEEDFSGNGEQQQPAESTKRIPKLAHQIETSLLAGSNTRTTQNLPIDQNEQRYEAVSKQNKPHAKEQLQCSNALSRIKGRQIIVQRDENIEKKRRQLPINAEEQPIVEAINENPVVIICGETGSGKTTQIPQFLYEAGYTSNGHLIGVTEPRRIAAISMASRVGHELDNEKLASYQIRYEGNRSEETKILFMTDGVLLKELQTDFTLSRYSVVVIDEAHERSIYSDVLIGLLSRICALRMKRGYPLKLIIMSATLKLQDFLRQRLFSSIQPKVVSVQARQFPVTIYFERRTPTNYLEATFKKVCKIHEEYPAGGILVFVTGQREVTHLVKLLENKYTKISTSKSLKKEKMKKCRRKKETNDEEEEGLLLDNDEFGTLDMDLEDEAWQNTFFGSDDESLNAPQSFKKHPPLLAIPLYSLLPVNLQKKIFDEPPDDGSRLCVVSTNVAETSLTLSNVRYVIDTGREKKREYDPITGVSRFVVGWCSKASADQRSGRAGRVQSGYAFRLYSSAVYEDMRDHSAPEILNKPIDQLILMLKAMNFTKIDHFPFPTPPKLDQIKSSELRLSHIGALRVQEGLYTITQLGQSLAQLPLTPSFAKVVISSIRGGLLPFAVTLVSALSVREPLLFISSMKEEETEERRKRMSEVIKQRFLWCAVGEARLFGDLTVILNTIGAADYVEENSRALEALGLRPKALKEINKQRHQLTLLLNKSDSVEKLPEKFRMDAPSQEQLRRLRHIMVKCHPDKLAKKVQSMDAPKGAYKTLILEGYVFIDQSSVLHKEQPDYVLREMDFLQPTSKISSPSAVCVLKNYFVTFGIVEQSDVGRAVQIAEYHLDGSINARLILTVAELRELYESVKSQQSVLIEGQETIQPLEKSIDQATMRIWEDMECGLRVLRVGHSTPFYNNLRELVIPIFNLEEFLDRVDNEMPSSSGSEKGNGRNGVRGEEEVKGGKEIASKTLNIQSKRFYLDVKQNDRGRFVKLAEVAMNGRKNRLFMSMRICKNIKELLGKFEGHVPASEEVNGKAENVTIQSESIVTERRRYYIDLRENRRGSFLRITQLETHSGIRNSVALPFEGIGQLHDALDSILEEYGEGFIEEEAELPHSQMIRTDGKSFFFDPGHNSRGDFLKITELKSFMGVRNSVVLSIRAIPQFTQVLSKLYDDFQELRAVEEVNVNNVLKKEPPKEAITDSNEESPKKETKSTD